MKTFNKLLDLLKLIESVEDRLGDDTAKLWTTFVKDYLPVDSLEPMKKLTPECLKALNSINRTCREALKNKNSQEGTLLDTEYVEWVDPENGLVHKMQKLTGHLYDGALFHIGKTNYKISYNKDYQKASGEYVDKEYVITIKNPSDGRSFWTYGYTLKQIEKGFQSHWEKGHTV